MPSLADNQDNSKTFQEIHFQCHHISIGLTSNASLWFDIAIKQYKMFCCYEKVVHHMPAYEMFLDTSKEFSEQQIEVLKRMGSVKLVFTIEEPTRKDAIRETLTLLEGFNSIYHCARTTQH